MLDTIGWAVLGVGAADLIGGLVWRCTGAPDAAIADTPALEPLVLFAPGQGLVEVQGAF